MGENERHRIAAAVRRAMGELAIAKTALAKESGIDFRTLERVLDARPVRPAQLSRLALFFGWAGDAFDAIAAGAEAPPVSRPSAEDRLDDLERRFDRIEQALQRLLAGDS